MGRKSVTSPQQKCCKLLWAVEGCPMFSKSWQVWSTIASENRSEETLQIPAFDWMSHAKTRAEALMLVLA